MCSKAQEKHFHNVLCLREVKGMVITMNQMDHQQKENLIEVNHLSVTFHNGKNVNNAVQDVTFRIKEGEVLGVVGESGSGKSVSAMSIMQLTPGEISGGEILFEGEDLLKKSEEEIKREQIAYLKEHEQEIIDYVKAQSPKIESVQIDWDQTQWSDGGLTTPEYYMNVYGRINHIEESGWGVNIPINEDNTLNMDEMYIGSDINIGGRLFD